MGNKNNVSHKKSSNPKIRETENRKKPKQKIPKSILEDIKSKYNFKNIFDFIKDDNFKYKLVVHSKKFQQKLELSVDKYHIKYLERFKINPIKYLNYNNFNSDICLGKNIIKEGLYKELSINNISNSIFQEYAKDYFNTYYNENEDVLYIDIFSPIFESLSTSKEIFEKFFIILKMFEIKKYNLELYYIPIFQNFKKLNINYYSLSITLNNDEEIKDLNNLYIDFNNLRKLELIFCYNVNITYPNSLQKVLFSNKGLENNLKYLHLVCSGEEIDYEIFENINNFKSLTELNIERCKFDEIVILELPDLEKLNISYCNNISLSENTSLNIKKLYFYKFELSKIGISYKFPRLEECRCNIQFFDLINISTLENLKKLVIDGKSDINLLDLQNKIPKLLSLNFILENGTKNKIGENIEIIESHHGGINEFSFTINNCLPNVKFYINKFENLHKVKFDLSGISDNYYPQITPENYFPIFKNNCFITFNYLLIFEFCTFKNNYNYITINNKIIQNVYENLNQMTNLRYFKFICVSRDIKLDFYRNFIKSLLLLNIKEIEFDIKNENNLQVNKDNTKEYTEKELKHLNPLVNFAKYKKIIIKKLII